VLDSWPSFARAINSSRRNGREGASRPSATHAAMGTKMHGADGLVESSV
jgi:hypothetical protein